MFCYVLSLSLRANSVLHDKKNNKRVFHKWNPEFKNDFFSEISRDVDKLCFNLNAYKDSGQSTDSLINLVSEFITNRGNKYFEIHRKMPNKP
jgi:hypothetical protein